MGKIGFGALITSVIFLFTGCGSVKQYNTQHDSGTYEISNFSDILFEGKSSPETVAKKIPDFCIYGKEGEEFKAKFILKWNDMDIHCNMDFNADKELIRTTLNFDIIKSDKLEDNTVNGIWDKIVSDLESEGVEVSFDNKVFSKDTTIVTKKTDNGPPYVNTGGDIHAKNSDHEYAVNVDDWIGGKLNDAGTDIEEYSHELTITCFDRMVFT